MILRPYQDKIINSTRESLRLGKRSPLIVSPTGSGKTVMFSYFCSQVVAKKKSVLVLAHRVELLEQISETLLKFKVDHGFIAPGYQKQYHKSVQVGSVFSVVRKLGRIPTPDLIIIDEAHHACKDSTWEKVIRFYSKSAYVIGVTATPCRLSGEPLGDVFDDMITGPTVKELIDIGSLSDYKVFAPGSLDTSQFRMRMGDFDKKQIDEAMDRPTITGDIINEYRKKSNGKRAAFYGCSVKHAENAAAQFKANGISSASIDGEMDKYKRKQIIGDFREGKIKVLTNFGIITEGFDVPSIESVILARPTQSLALYLQMVGRALRPMPNKPYATILDHVNAIRTHGLPDDEREWSLTGSMKKPSEAGGMTVKTCDVCYAVQPPGSLECNFCGHIFPIKVREVEEVEGDLLELDKEKLREEFLKKAKRKEQGRAQTMDELVAIGKQRGMKNPRGWAQHVFQSRQAKKLKGFG